MAPSYTQLVEMYFQTQRTLIAGHSTSIARDTLEIYQICRNWAPDADLDTDGMMTMYLETLAD